MTTEKQIFGEETVRIDEATRAVWKEPNMQKLLSILTITLAEVMAMRLTSYTQMDGVLSADAAKDEIIQAIVQILEWAGTMMDDEPEDAE